jgi:hypothetical protein
MVRRQTRTLRRVVAAVLGASEDELGSAPPPAGYVEGVDPARRRWLERLVGICDQALDELPHADEPPLELMADFGEFRARLVAELKTEAAENGTGRR